VDPATYRVGPGDEIALRYSDLLDPILLRVGPAGDLTLPNVGPIPVGGLTLAVLDSQIRERMRPYVRGKGFAITLHRPRRFRMPVLGEVRDPGAVTLQAPARASEAIAAAGGVGVGGVRRGIVIRRGADTLLADLVRTERSGDLAGDPLIFETDVIHVPPRGKFIEILGAVPHPGRYDFLPGDRLSDLVTLAGRALPQAALEHAQLTRMDERGLPAPRPVRLQDALLAPAGADDLPLVEGDRLYVPMEAHWREGPRVEVVGEVTRPGPYPITEGVDRIRSVLERAGGFTELAERAALRVERSISVAMPDTALLSLARAGDPSLVRADLEQALLMTRERRAIAAEVGAMLERGDENGNALLLDGDRIVVPRHRPVVSVQGEVLTPGYVRFQRGRKLSDYIEDAGGLTRRADRRHIRVTRASTDQRLSFKEVKEIHPEDVIWVPTKRGRSAWETTRDLIAAVSQAATVFLVIREATR
jgi:protein involved in polysaccharide export with SLBB domain